MQHNTLNTVGIDLSKAHLDAYALPARRTARFDNTANGIKRLAKWIATSVHCVVYESTGPWHRRLEETLADTLPMACVNAMRARRFAQAMGCKAKTDAVDAQVLAAMGAAMHPGALAYPPRPAGTAPRTGCPDQGPYGGITSTKACTSCTAQAATAPPAGAKPPPRLCQAIAKLVDAGRDNPRCWQSSPVTATGLATCPNSAKAAASLAGLAPATRESGQWKGYSFIRGGRARPRSLLYMAALSAIRHNPDLARQYTRLRERGKPPKVALTAIMRKLIVLANTLLHQNRPWTPDPASSSR